jgi:hypothetical protein
VTLGLALLAALLLPPGCGGGGGGGPPPFEGPIVGNGTTEPPPGGGGGGGGTTPLSFRVLDQGTDSLISSFRLTEARDIAAWGALWCEHHGVMPPGVGAPDIGPPLVDFDTEIVVGIFLGTRPTAGFTVDVVSVAASGDGLAVDYLEVEKGASCGVAQVITTPFVLVAVTRRDGPVTYSGMTRVDDCP